MALTYVWEYGTWLTAFALLTLGLSALRAGWRYRAPSLLGASTGFLVAGVSAGVLAATTVPLSGGSGAAEWSLIAWAHPLALVGLLAGALCFAWFAFTGAGAPRT
jgi:hypothetical protein